jgi:DNA-binding transcriptional regulator/RsmH inhibitor MraZ
MSERPKSPSDSLIGTEYATVDEKGRLFLSQEKRFALRDTCWFVFDPIGCIAIFPEHIGNDLIDLVGGPAFNLEVFLDPTAKHLMRELLGVMEKGRIDSGGRVIVPRFHREEAGIEKGANEVVIRGMGMWAELWEKGRFNEYRKGALAAHDGSLEKLISNALLARNKALDRSMVLPKTPGEME